MFGGMLGIFIGCILGMIPLYLYRPTMNLDILENLFEKLDADGNGALDRDEIISFLNSSTGELEDSGALNFLQGSPLSSTVSAGSIDWCIAKYDVNNDGNLDFGEICLMLQDFGILQPHAMPQSGGFFGLFKRDD